MHEISDGVEKLLAKGYKQAKGLECAVSSDWQRHQQVSRRWRNLVGEAKFDIPPCLHEYINWQMPKEWEYMRRPQKMFIHDFVIDLPGFKPISVLYRHNGTDWLFDRFEIISAHHQTVTSTKYMDLPLFLAMARELAGSYKREVRIEEIKGDLADNAKLIKTNEVKVKQKFNMRDFMNNPDVDIDPSQLSSFEVKDDEFDYTIYPGYGTA